MFLGKLSIKNLRGPQEAIAFLISLTTKSLGNYFLYFMRLIINSASAPFLSFSNCIMS